MDNDKFTITATYSRSEIVEMAKRGIEAKAEPRRIVQALNEIFPGWRMDTRTSLMVQLMILPEDDEFQRPIFEKKLAEMDMQEAGQVH